MKTQFDPEVPVTKRTNVKGRVNSLSKSEVVSKRSISCDSRLTRKRDSSMDTERKSKDKIETNYAVLSQVSIKSFSILNLRIGRNATLFCVILFVLCRKIMLSIKHRLFNVKVIQVDLV